MLLTLHNTQKIGATRVSSIFNVENDAVDGFSLARHIFEYWKIENPFVSKWNTDFDSCYNMLP